MKECEGISQRAYMNNTDNTVVMAGGKEMWEQDGGRQRGEMGALTMKIKEK